MPPACRSERSIAFQAENGDAEHGRERRARAVAKPSSCTVGRVRQPPLFATAHDRLSSFYTRIQGGGVQPLPLPIYAAALAAQKAGTANAIILLAGDSTFVSNNANAGANDVASGVPTKLAQLISGGSWQSSFGDKNTLAAGSSPPLTNFDSRLTLGDWTQVISSTTTWGGMLLRGTAGTTPFTVTPTAPFDTFEWYTTQNTGQGSMSAQIDSESAVAIDANAAKAVRKTTLTTTLGLHTAKL